MRGAFPMAREAALGCLHERPTARHIPVWLFQASVFLCASLAGVFAIAAPMRDQGYARALLQAPDATSGLGHGASHPVLPSSLDEQDPRLLDQTDARLWTDAETALVWSLFADGLSVSDISDELFARLGTSRSAMAVTMRLMKDRRRYRELRLARKAMPQRTLPGPGVPLHASPPPPTAPQWTPAETQFLWQLVFSGTRDNKEIARTLNERFGTRRTSGAVSTRLGRTRDAFLKDNIPIPTPSSVRFQRNVAPGGKAGVTVQAPRRQASVVRRRPWTPAEDALVWQLRDQGSLGPSAICTQLLTTLGSNRSPHAVALRLRLLEERRREAAAASPPLPASPGALRALSSGSSEIPLQSGGGAGVAAVLAPAPPAAEPAAMPTEYNAAFTAEEAEEILRMLDFLEPT